MTTDLTCAPPTTGRVMDVKMPGLIEMFLKLPYLPLIDGKVCQLSLVHIKGRAKLMYHYTNCGDIHLHSSDIKNDDDFADAIVYISQELEVKKKRASTQKLWIKKHLHPLSFYYNGVIISRHDFDRLELHDSPFTFDEDGELIAQTLPEKEVGKFWRTKANKEAILCWFDNNLQVNQQVIL